MRLGRTTTHENDDTRQQRSDQISQPRRVYQLKQRLGSWAVQFVDVRWILRGAQVFGESGSPCALANNALAAAAERKADRKKSIVAPAESIADRVEPTAFYPNV